MRKEPQNKLKQAMIGVVSFVTFVALAQTIHPLFEEAEAIQPNIARGFRAEAGIMPWPMNGYWQGNTGYAHTSFNFQGNNKQKVFSVTGWNHGYMFGVATNSSYYTTAAVWSQTAYFSSEEVFQGIVYAQITDPTWQPEKYYFSQANIY